ncbi:MAG: hypothetical protein WA715_28260 [Candidatus Acidiferrum sp.]|jgi:hypothetical protein
MLKPLRDSETGAIAYNIVALRRELVQAERQLRERAEREAVRLANAERGEWRIAREDCLQLERIRRDATERLIAIGSGGKTRFRDEAALAELALRDVETWELHDSAVYTIISFANRRDRLRFLVGGADREAVMREALAQGGVYTERGYFQEILK